MRFVKTGPTRIRGLVGRRRPVLAQSGPTHRRCDVRNDPKRTFQRRWRCHSMGEHAPLTLVAITFLDARSSIESVRRDAESPLPAHRVCRALALGLLPVGVSRSGRWVSQLRKHRGHAGRGNRLASSIPALRLSCAVCLLPSHVRLLCASARVCLLSTPRMTPMRLRPPRVW